MPYHDPFQASHSFDFPPPPGRSGSRMPPTFLPRRAMYGNAQPGPMPADGSHPQVQFQAQASAQAQDHGPTPDGVPEKWFNNSNAKRINTEIYVYQALKLANPGVEVLDTVPYNADILTYVQATGDGSIENLTKDSKLSTLFDGNFELRGDIPDSSKGDRTKESTKSSSDVLDSMNIIYFIPPARRLDGGSGALIIDPLFDRFRVKWQDFEFEVYIVDTRDGCIGYPQKRQYILTTEVTAAMGLIRTAGIWQNNLHEEIWVFDQGFWNKDPALYQAIQKSTWKDIILPEELKEDLLKTVLRFYDSQETYDRLRVPWKRGLIFYGPPGNGKTVSIKATMKTLLDRKDSVPTLYVKSLKSFFGPEASISQIFALARQQAPCYLVFEDLDSLVGDDVRSFFLNAVDGLSENEGILMVGSTNHLERLDPGIAKRPSRFDRKYLFPVPALAERKRYCHYWQKKLKENDAIKFPDKLVGPISRLTDGFSFAYMQEAFVSALLKIANDEEQDPGEEEHWDLVDELEELEIIGNDKGGDDDGDELDKYVLWREIKVQIANLRKELNHGDNGDD